MRISDWSSDVCSSDLLGVVWTGAGKAGRLIGRGVGALFGRLRKRGPSEDGDGDEDDFDPKSTYEVGIAGTSSEERRVGKECASTCRCRGTTYTERKKR